MIRASTIRWVPLVIGLVTSQIAMAQPEWRTWGSGSQPTTQTPGSIPAATDNDTVAEPTGSRGTSTILMELMERVDQLEQELRSLRGQNEVQANELERLKKALRDGFVDLDGRVSTLEGGGGAAPAGEASPGTASEETPQEPERAEPSPAEPAAPEPEPATEPEPTQTPEPADEAADQRALYDRAFALLRDGNYEQAIAAFDRTVKADPVGNWAPHALYWKGEAEYVNQDRDAARASFEKVLSDYPNSTRAADASLKIAYLDYDLGEYDKARARLAQIVERHEGSHAAGLAQQRLDRMDREGL
ncbi:MAG: tetratricopeptide repeat protein [Halothiobacillaceae bacterium]